MLTIEQQEQIKSEIFMSLGHASMCWENPCGAGTFDSTTAKRIGDDLYNKILGAFDTAWRQATVAKA